MMFLYLTLLISFSSIVASFGSEQIDEEIRNLILNSGIGYNGFRRYPDYYEFPRNLTASSVFDPLTQKCCKGTVHQGNNVVGECCGENIYDKSTQLCCNGQVRERNYGYLCCGEESYNTKTSICCNNAVSDLPPNVDSNNIACCENKTYDTINQLCCSSEVYGYQLVPVDKRNKDDTACCATQTYNPITSSCCSDSVNGVTTSVVLQHQGNKTSCCGLQLFDPEHEGASLGCCGTKTFNYETELCCFANTESIVTLKTSKNDYCCLDKPYNGLKQICCNDKILDNVDGKRICCGDEVINNDKQVCCYMDGRVQGVRKTSENDTGCCGNSPYDSEKNLCCYENGENVLVKKTTPDDYLCCGLTSYNPSKDLCCLNGELSDPNVYHGSVYNRVCCGDKSIDVNTHYCCGGVAVSFIERNVACCGNELLYDPAVETCCWNGGKFKPKLFPYSEGMSCCGDKMYNSSSNEMCCDGKLYKWNGVNDGCCGDRVYDYKKEVCCGDNILPKTNDQSQCCFTYMTDEDKDCLVKIQPHIEKALSSVMKPRSPVY